MKTDNAAPWEDLVLRGPAAEVQPPRPPEPAKTPFQASYLTHELRAPLTSIRSALSLLQEKLEGRLDGDSTLMLGLAIKNTERLSGLINDILDYSKLQAGKISLKRQPVAPRILVQEAVESLKAWAVSKGIKLLRRPDEEPLPRVDADPDRIVQILTNLVSNALKFSPAGGRVEVWARLGGGEHAGTVIFSVKDTGPGIKSEDQDRIFHSFEQTTSGQKACEGTGLGLTLAKAMVELHGGRIWVESWKGLGATFRFTIPIAVEDLAAPVRVYPEAVKVHGLLAGFFRHLNAFTAFFS